jgi:hypothetical protein
MSDAQNTPKTRLRSASKRQQTVGTKVLRARPLKDKINYAELSREHIARYPKIRARLAE